MNTPTKLNFWRLLLSKKPLLFANILFDSLLIKDEFYPITIHARGVKLNQNTRLWIIMFYKQCRKNRSFFKKNQNWYFHIHASFRLRSLTKSTGDNEVIPKARSQIVNPLQNNYSNFTASIINLYNKPAFTPQTNTPASSILTCRNRFQFFSENPATSSKDKQDKADNLTTSILICD